MYSSLDADARFAHPAPFVEWRPRVVHGSALLQITPPASRGVRRCWIIGAAARGSDGVAVFDALPRPGTVSEAMLYAFDLLELDGKDLRAMPLVDRKRRPARLLGAARRRPERARRDDGEDLRAACRLVQAD
jgi:hypothetical protein